MKKFFVFLAGALLLNSTFASAQRESFRVNENYHHSSTAARNLEATHEFLVTPLLAEVQIQDSVSKHPKEFKRDYHLYTNDTDKLQTIDQLKRQALFDFAYEYNADVIVGAQTSARTVDDDNDGQSDRDGDRYVIRITILGYPANYVKFRSATAADVNLIKSSQFWHKDPNAQNAKNEAALSSKSGLVTKGQRTVLATE
ncbi:MAG: hypothetical protein J1D85_00930 [Bacteroidales bacterium]|nr:hypothetical protein [Bacteroidales bacterium]